MSYELDEEGNKVFYEQGLDEEEFREEKEKDFLIKFDGTIYISALDEEEALNKFNDRDDISEYVDNTKIE
jgi:hypothetical protein